LPELIEALAQGDYEAGYQAGQLLDPNWRGEDESTEGTDRERAWELYVRANAICEQLAAAGDPHAQMSLGARYLLGQGCTRCEVTAAYWLERAFAGGMHVVAVSLASLFLHGRKDVPRAQLWYDRAKEHGCAFICIPELE